MKEFTKLIGDLYTCEGTVYYDDLGIFREVHFFPCDEREKIVLNSENVKSLRWKTDSKGRPQIPSDYFGDCFPFPDFYDDEFQEFVRFFRKELDYADNKALEEIKPVERLTIKDKFSDYVEDSKLWAILGNWEWDPFETIQSFIKAVRVNELIPKPVFLNNKEIEETCKEYLRQKNCNI